MRADLSEAGDVVAELEFLAGSLDVAAKGPYGRKMREQYARDAANIRSAATALRALRDAPVVIPELINDDGGSACISVGHWRNDHARLVGQRVLLVVMKESGNVTGVQNLNTPYEENSDG